MKVVIIGLQGSGKTFLVKHYFLKSTPYHIVFDPNDEYVGYRRYVPHQKSIEDEDILREEVKLFVKKMVKPNIWSIEQKEKTGKEKTKRLQLVAFDEADLILPARKNINYALRDLWVNSRHYRIDLVAVTRRPTDLNAYVMDTADYLIVFKVPGLNAIRTLREINPKAQDAVNRLDYKKYEFLLFDRDREFSVNTLNSMPEIA